MLREYFLTKQDLGRRYSEPQGRFIWLLELLDPSPSPIAKQKHQDTDTGKAKKQLSLQCLVRDQPLFPALSPPSPASSPPSLPPQVPQTLP